MSTNTKTRHLTVIAMLGGVAAVLMFFEIPIPFLIPSFIKLDFSELPALLGAYSLGPWAGIAICFIKNLVGLLHTTTGGIGELSNFLIGCAFVVPAALIYKAKKTRKFAILGALIGAIFMAALCYPINYYVIYPMYTKFMPLEAMISAYQAIRPSVNGLQECILLFNVPFTFFKGALDLILSLFIYKPLSPLLHK